MNAINDILEIAGETFNIRPKTLIATSCVGLPTAITLLVLAKLAIIGALSATTIGACSIGLGGGIFLLSLPGLRGSRFVRGLIIGGLAAAALITIGALGIAGMVSAQVIGWTILADFSAHGVAFVSIEGGLAIKHFC